jgi:glycosyltransferase involved in cell wall biosynthesis
MSQPAASHRPVVAIVYRYVHQYRREFYDRLRDRLAAADVELRLIAGEPGPEDASKGDAIEVPWARAIDNVVVPFGQREIYWQPVFRHVRDADLVIVEQASKLLVNYLLIAARRFGGPRVAFWGQGLNVYRHRASPMGEAVKRVMSRRVDWWFAYNEMSLDVVLGLGFPPERITCVQNSIDTHALRAARAGVGAAELDDVRAAIGVASRNVGVYAGALYADKRIDFLIAASDLVRQRVADFELVIIGSGSDEHTAREAAVTRPWLHVLGARFGKEKVHIMALAKALLLPGLVGLGILDGFALELPLITTSGPYHGHEIDYLDPDENGLIVADWRNPHAYAEAIAAVMTDDDLLERLRAGCREARERYTVETMVERFANGVLLALSAPRGSGAWAFEARP